jgi:hypothetical protein
LVICNWLDSLPGELLSQATLMCVWGEGERGRGRGRGRGLLFAGDAIHSLPCHASISHRSSPSRIAKLCPDRTSVSMHAFIRKVDSAMQHLQQDGPPAGPAPKKPRIKQSDRRCTMDGTTYVCDGCKMRFTKNRWRRHNALLRSGNTCEQAMVDGRLAVPQGLSVLTVSCFPVITEPAT